MDGLAAKAGEAMSTLKDTPVQPATGEVIKLMATNAKAKALNEQVERVLESALGLSPPPTAHDLAPLVELIRVEDAATAQAAIDVGCLPTNVLAAVAEIRPEEVMEEGVDDSLLVVRPVTDDAAECVVSGAAR